MQVTTTRYNEPMKLIEDMDSNMALRSKNKQEVLGFNITIKWASIIVLQMKPKSFETKLRSIRQRELKPIHLKI